MNRGDLRPNGAATGRQSASSDNTRSVQPKLFRLNPADIVAIAYLMLTTFLTLIFSYRIDRWVALTMAHAVGIAVVVSIAVWEGAVHRSGNPSSATRLAGFVRGWYPVALIPITYKELSYLIPLVHPHDFDTALAAIDYRVLGVNPTVWLERLTWPPLTEALQLTYSSYYLLPIILGVVLWRAGRFKEFNFWVFVIVLGFYLSYLGYIAVPAIGPRFLPEIVEAQTKPLTGVWLFQPVRAMLDRAEGITRDCFPSGHTEVTLLVLCFAHKLHRKTFWWLLPLGTCIILSTVYLRYHYVVDVLAGALLTFAIVMTARPLYRCLGGDKARELP